VGLLSTVIVAVYVYGSGRLVTTDQQWFRSLLKPAWQPPRFVPALIWPYNFALLVTASWIVASRISGTQQLVWLACLALSVLAALSWASLFFKSHSLLSSAIALVFATVLSLPLLVIAFRVSLPLGVAFVPYQLWLALATSLAFSYASQ